MCYICSVYPASELWREFAIVMDIKSVGFGTQNRVGVGSLGTLLTLDINTQVLVSCWTLAGHFAYIISIGMAESNYINVYYICFNM